MWDLVKKDKCNFKMRLIISESTKAFKTNVNAIATRDRVKREGVDEEWREIGQTNIS